AVNALAAAGDLESLDRKDELRDWLLAQQYKQRHPFTGAEAGAWAWTALPGGVPDADDTPGAILALARLLPPAVVNDFISETAGTVSFQELDSGFRANRFDFPDKAGHPGLAILFGLSWLSRLQNRDGGMPTFC